MNRFHTALFTASVIALTATLTQAADASSTSASAVAVAVPMTSAEVRKVDKENKKITLKHGEIKNLDMPPMTMVFKVKDAAMLDKLQPGDKLMFAAEKIDGAYTVTVMEAAK
jgi:Cu(I)/Ag(I) efflux system periplasmic protein CusF